MTLAQTLEQRCLLAAVTSVATSGLNITAGTGNLNEGDVVTFTVSFDAAVVVNRSSGSPTLSLNDSGIATYASGSGSASLTFIHIVAPGQSSNDLAVTTLRLNGCSIRDLSGVDATLTGAVTNPAGTLVVDTLQPIVQSINRTTPPDATTNASTVAWTVTLSESVSGVDLSDFLVVRTGYVAFSQAVLTPVSGSVYTVTVSGITGNGSVGLNLVDNGSVRDPSGNALTALNAVIAFQPQRIVTAGTRSIPVVVTDLNLDGWQDLVTANLEDNTVGVMLGLGNGTFQVQQTTSVGLHPIAVVAGDLNGDGRVDIISSNENESSVSVLLGNGDGTFRTHQTYATGVAPFALALGDVNGDGKLDLASANFSANPTVSLLLGNGDGTFQVQQQLPVGDAPSSVSFSDVNLDGRLDLVVTKLPANSVSILLGNGNGTFQAQQTIPVGINPWTTGTGDFNGDNKPDVLVANNNGHTLSLFSGNGDGTFQLQQVFSSEYSPTSAVIADLNGDRRPDLLAGNWNTHNIRVFRSNGNGTFHVPQTFETGLNPRGLSLADLNGDGRPDLVTANEIGNSLSVLLNDSRGDFTGQIYNIGIRLLAPNPNAFTLRPTFSWSPAAGATAYEIHINNESTGVARFHTATVSGTSYTPAVDLPIGKYRMWIRPVFGVAPGSWTPPFDFWILTAPTWQPLERVQLTSRPTLAWNSLPGSAQYDLWIDNFSTGQKQLVRQNVVGTTWTPGSDLPMGTYRAWIRGIDAKGTPAGWSALSEFQVLPGPTPTGPLSATFNRRPAFSWNAVTGAVSYDVYVRNQNTGVMVYNGVSSTSTTWTPPIVLPDGPYRWYVFAVSAGNLRSGGATTTDIFIGGRPTILAPNGGVWDTRPTFIWRPVDQAASYRLAIHRLNVPPEIGVTNLVGLTSAEFTPTTPLVPGTYRAWVRAVSTTGELSQWSLEVNFTVAVIAPLLEILDWDFVLTGLLMSPVAQVDVVTDVQELPNQDSMPNELAIDYPSSQRVASAIGREQQSDSRDVQLWS